MRISPAPFNSETFHARLIFDSGSLATSWEQLRTVNGKLCATFADAAKELGLLHDHHTATIVFAEALASELHTPCRARVLLLAVRHMSLEHISTSLPSHNCM